MTEAEFLALPRWGTLAIALEKRDFSNAERVADVLYGAAPPNTGIQNTLYHLAELCQDLDKVWR